MALAVTALTVGGLHATQSSYTTASVSPTAGRKLVCIVINSKGTGGNAPAVPGSLSGLGVTWSQPGTQTGNTYNSGAATAGGFGRIASVWLGEGTVSSGTLAIGFASSQWNCCWALYEVAELDTLRQIVFDWAAATQTIEVTLAAFGAVGNGTLIAGLNDFSTGFTPGTGLTEAGEALTAGGDFASAWRNDNDTTPSMDGSQGEDWLAVAVELAVAVAGGGAAMPVLLQRRY